MIGLAHHLTARHGLKIAVVNREGRDLKAYRIRAGTFPECVDLLTSSCVVHIRKPDADIFRAALDIIQIPASRGVPMDDRRMCVKIAEALGVRGSHHPDHQSTRAAPAARGVVCAERGKDSL
jgi:putative hydrolase of the HAD superfamily